MPAKRRIHSTVAQKLTGLLAEDAVASTVAFGPKIASVTKARSKNHDRLLPGFIDLQINGAHGIDVMSAGVQDLLRLSNALAHEGTTAWLPTVITAPLDTIERCGEVIAEAMAAQREMESAARRGSRQPVGAMILGMHLEGPFISPKRLGAHSGLNLLPEGVSLDRVLGLKTLKLITLAPELDGALAAIPRLVACGVTVSIGHTDATYEQACAALDAGATMFTHLFNAMPPFHHRSPGPIGAAAQSHTAIVTLIPDGTHVHPATIRLCRALRLAFITDRLAFAGAGEPPKTLFGQPRGGAYRDGRVVRVADGTLAGTAITMLEAAQMMFCGLDRDGGAIARATSTHAAEALQLSDRGQIFPGARADLILLDRDLNLKAVFLAGREVN